MVIPIGVIAFSPAGVGLVPDGGALVETAGGTVGRPTVRPLLLAAAAAPRPSGSPPVRRGVEAPHPVVATGAPLGAPNTHVQVAEAVGALGPTKTPTPLADAPDGQEGAGVATALGRATAVPRTCPGVAVDQARPPAFGRPGDVGRALAGRPAVMVVPQVAHKDAPVAPPVFPTGTSLSFVDYA